MRRAAALICLLAAPTAVHANTTGPDLRDRDDDGVSDAQERALGLDPTTTNVPEPLLFDMVRGLGARRGELELNTLAFTTSRRSYGIEGGPELEYVFAPGHAVEIELPASTAAGVLSWKGALQGTLPAPNAGRFLHGWLLIGEYLLGDPGGKASATYIAALRLNHRWSTLLLIGGAFSRVRYGDPHAYARINPSVFYDVSPKTTLGLEVQSRLGQRGERELVLLPQMHWHASRAWKLQVGAGSETSRHLGTALLGALRLSYTY